MKEKIIALIGCAIIVLSCIFIIGTCERALDDIEKERVEYINGLNGGKDENK